MDIHDLRLQALNVAWLAEQRPAGATYPQPTAQEVIARARLYAAFLEGKAVPFEIPADLLDPSPEWIKAAQEYVRKQRASKRRPRPKRHR